MGSLSRYSAESPIMDISIQLGDKKYSFNLYKEIKIDIDNATNQIAKQPALYGFVISMHRRVNSLLEEAEVERKRHYARLYIKYKGESTGSRPSGDELVKSRIEVEAKYINLTDKVMLLRRNRDALEGCVKAFEHRKDLLQTLSANLRRET